MPSSEVNDDNEKKDDVAEVMIYSLRLATGLYWYHHGWRFPCRQSHAPSAVTALPTKVRLPDIWISTTLEASLALVGSEPAKQYAFIKLCVAGTDLDEVLMQAEPGNPEGLE
eukprot:scaffold616_cov257-Pinguiococcus_pyrenoidosus.AAC.19